MSELNQDEKPANLGNGSVLMKNLRSRIITPLEMRFEPKEDITVYELAKCLPYLVRNNGVMPFGIDKSETHFRHFKIIDHN